MPTSCCGCDQIYSGGGRAEPKVKASQCFTKYKWRDDAAAQRESGPQIVATQVWMLRPRVNTEVFAIDTSHIME